MIAVDTNVLIYQIDVRDLAKRQRADSLLASLAQRRGGTLMLWQVLAEFSGQAYRWQSAKTLTKAEFHQAVHYVQRIFPVIVPTLRALEFGLGLLDRYQLSYWDALLLGACIDAGIDTLYTEDMGAPAQYDSVQLNNPFA